MLLFIAVVGGRWRQGADLNLSDKDGLTPLALACSSRWRAVDDADTHDRDATRVGSFVSFGVSKREAAEMLLACGAEADVPAADGKTALMGSMNWENEDAFHVLLDAGCDVVRNRAHCVPPPQRLLAGSAAAARYV